MKFLSLVVALVVSIHCCAAQTNNRTSLWLLANSQIFAYNSRVPQTCYITTATPIVESTSTTLLSTSNLLITGKFVRLSQADADFGFVPSQSILSSVSIQFIYNSTYSITLALPVQTTTGGIPNQHLTTTNLFNPSAITYWTSTVGSSATNPYPVVLGGNSIMSPTGSTWLSAQNIPSIFVSQSTAAVPNQIPASSGIIITDYVSSSTIAVSLWNDNTGSSAADTGVYNAFYQLGIRTKSSSLSSTSSVLLNGASCTLSAGRKRSVDHLINKRTVLTPCTSFTSIDPTMTSSVLSTICSTITAIHRAGVGATDQTVSNLGDAFNKAVIAQNALYQADFAVFGAGSSKFAIASNFGMLIAMSSIIFSFLN